MNPEKTEWTTTFYGRPSLHSDGTLYMTASWYGNDGSHASGFAMVSPDRSDYDLWLWVTSRWDELRAAGGDHWLMSNHELERLRPQFEAESAEATSADAFRAHLLSLIPVVPEPSEQDLKTWQRQWRKEERFVRVMLFSFDLLFGPPLSVYMWFRDR